MVSISIARILVVIGLCSMEGGTVAARAGLARREFDLGPMAGLGGGHSFWPGSTPAAASAGERKLPGFSHGGCPSYYMIGARGTGETLDGSLPYSSIYENVLAAVPGGAKQELQYSTSVEYFATVNEGAQSEVEIISAQLAKCPDTVFVLIGYSKGAMVQTQALINQDMPQDKIAAVVLFGNPYFRAGATQNKCDATSGMGMAAMTGVKMPDQLADRVYDCCAAGDPICQTVGSIMSHFTYSSRANEASQFIIRKLRAKLSS
ncbi:uncharacterized protein VP01_3072g2 [Puccinia sorghi]|uniref:Cutinase n=1 Tax=Puccinia sorghi TaxID=27349 RepID=A0A0L6UZU4_9BASI|nr:uncharacterized protein VP01_3072g2 [Puccinia sorghi]